MPKNTRLSLIEPVVRTSVEKNSTPIPRNPKNNQFCPGNISLGFFRSQYHNEIVTKPNHHLNREEGRET